MHTMTIHVTQQQIAAWEAGTPITEAMPQLTDAQRIFMATGITEAEMFWVVTDGGERAIDDIEMDDIDGPDFG